MTQSFVVLFVCQGGAIEFQSLILAASLNRYLKLDAKVIAMVPVPVHHIRFPADRTLGLLQELGVQIVEFKNPWVHSIANISVADLLTNKMFCLSAFKGVDKVIFIDSDTCFFKELPYHERFTVPINLKLIGYPGAVIMSHWWRELSRHFQVDLPSVRFHIEQPGKPAVQIPPFFNTSFFALPSSEVDRFKRGWLEAYERISRLSLSPDNRYQREQAAFALAVHQSGLAYEFCHEHLSQYCLHYSKGLDRHPAWVRRIAELLKEYPDIRSYVLKNEIWQKHLCEN